MSLWYQRDVHRIALYAAVLLCLAGCGAAPDEDSAPPAMTMSSSVEGHFVTPSNIRRVRADMPAGYEVTDLATPAAPATLWGFGLEWATDPSDCAALADPVGAAPAQGLSASGPGGIIYTAVAGSVGAALELDPAVIATCPRWSMTSPRTTGTVSFVEAPEIPNAQSVGMTSSVETVVEGGTSTSSTAFTYVAYLRDGYIAYVVLVVDPGLAEFALDPKFAETLLVKTVSALRS